MELIATTRPEAVALAYGAYLTPDGTRLRCGLLFVKRGNTRKIVVFRCLETNTRIRVRLPSEAFKPARNLRFSREELEVIS